MSKVVTFAVVERGIVALAKCSLVLTNWINFCLLGQLECYVNWFQIILMNAEMRNATFSQQLSFICRIFVALATAAKRGLTPAPLWIPPASPKSNLIFKRLLNVNINAMKQRPCCTWLARPLRSLSRIIHLKSIFRFD